MPKCAVIFYHKNINNLYRPEWIQLCVDSIKNQTFKDFDVFELCYGGLAAKYCEGISPRYYFLETQFENHIGAMNFCYDLIFNAGYDVVFNTNMDDFYSAGRFEKQLDAIEKGAQLVSSNFRYFNNGAYIKDLIFHNRSISKELMRGHNIIAHPVIAMHRSFWDGLRYKDSLGNEDLLLWKEAVTKGKKIVILPDFLLSYRLHQNQVTKKYRR
jgi:glycosyltransferase involved in cell wall biosynthesis